MTAQPRFHIMSLIGRLAREPELITTDSGTDIAKLRLAVDRRRRDDGAVFVDVKCFEAQARARAEHLAKGRQVAVSGRLELDEWQAHEGTKRSRLYVIAQRVQFLSGKAAEEQRPAVAGHDGGEEAGLEQPPGPRPVRPRAKRQTGGHPR
jgi:single-strand DNA-binding protein